MGKHDEYGHNIHAKRRARLDQMKPPNAFLHQSSTPPQAPSRKSTNYNRYLGHGKGV